MGNSGEARLGAGPVNPPELYKLDKELIMPVLPICSIEELVTASTRSC